MNIIVNYPKTEQGMKELAREGVTLTEEIKQTAQDIREDAIESNARLILNLRFSFI